jgi:hypothetical protein
MMIVDAPWFETFRLIALTLIYLGFLLQLYTLRSSYRQFKRWADEEAERRERWAEDKIQIQKLREEAYHLRAQAEVALAQARRHLPNGPGVQ